MLLALVTATAAITIGGNDRIFADGFEASP
jgi:hypothetical protein